MILFIISRIDFGDIDGAILLGVGAWEVATASQNVMLTYQAEAEAIMNYLWHGEQIIEAYAVS